MCFLTGYCTLCSILSLGEKVVNAVDVTNMTGGGQLRIIRDTGRSLSSANMSTKFLSLDPLTHVKQCDSTHVFVTPVVFHPGVSGDNSILGLASHLALLIWELQAQ